MYERDRCRLGLYRGSLLSGQRFHYLRNEYTKVSKSHAREFELLSTQVLIDFV